MKTDGDRWGTGWGRYDIVTKLTISYRPHPVPCPSCPYYSDSSIYEKTMLEALQSPLFMAYHDLQPFNENHLRVCPLLDNPDAIVEMVETTGACSTDLQDPEDVNDLADKCRDKANDW